MNFELYAEVAGEKLHRARHSGGLTVLHHEKPERVRAFATVIVPFGSIDEDPADGIPHGTAHFLEHLLFEEEAGDVALEFSERGAFCNAATEHHRTSYQFSGVDQHEQNLRTLLRLVQNPHFSDASVRRERKIIDQELAMYDDDPDWRGFVLLLEALYHRHPIRNHVAGTSRSIEGVDAAVLRRCHRRHYHPGGLVLSVSGPIERERLIEVVEQAMPAAPPEPPASRPALPAEPPGVRARHVELEMAISRPQLWMGFKDEHAGTEGREGLRRELALRLGLELLFSASSSAYEELEGRGLIDDGFDAFHTAERDVGFTMIASDTDDPEGLEQALREVLRRSQEQGFADDEFELLRRRHLGRTLRTFDSPESVAGLMADCHARGTHPGELVELMAGLRKEELEQRLREDLREEACAVAVLRPERRR